MPQRRLQYIHMAGIQRQGQIRHAAYLFQGAQHHLLFIDSAHSHIDIQNSGSALLLLPGELQHFVKAALPQLGLKHLFSGGINSFPHNQKPIFQTESDCPALGGKYPGRIFPSPDVRYRTFSNTPAKSLYVFGACPAASSQYGGPCLRQKFHLPCKFLRCHAVAALPILIQIRQSGVGFCNNGNTGSTRNHVGHKPAHLPGSGGTIDTYGRRPETFQDNGGRFRIRPVQSPPVRFKSHGDHHRQVADLLGRNQGRPGLRQAHHGLHHKQIHPCLPE